MKWQQFLPLALVVVAAMLMVWRSSGKKAGGCDCKCACSHEPDGAAKKEDAVR